MKEAPRLTNQNLSAERKVCAKSAVNCVQYLIGPGQEMRGKKPAIEYLKFIKIALLFKSAD